MIKKTGGSGCGRWEEIKGFPATVEVVPKCQLRVSMMKQVRAPR